MGSRPLLLALVAVATTLYGRSEQRAGTVPPGPGVETWPRPSELGPLASVEHVVPANSFTSVGRYLKPERSGP